MHRLDFVGTVTGARFGAASAHLELVAGGTAAAPVLVAVNHVTRETVTLALAAGQVATVTGHVVQSAPRIAVTVDGVAGSLLPEAVEQARAQAGGQSFSTFLSASNATAGQAVELLSLQVQGVSYLYAARPGGQGISVFSLPGGATATPVQVVADTSGTYAAGITAMTAAQVGGQSYLFAAARGENGVQVYAVGADGSLTARPGAGVAQGVALSQPSALASVTMAGQAYLIAAASGSSSLTVFRVAADGGLVAVDHLIDELGSRFAGVTVMDTLAVDGRVFVAVAGTDAGVSLFSMLPDGRLIHLAALADTAAAALQHVSAIEMVRVGSDLQVIVGAGGEAGLTVLRVPLSGVGSVLPAPGGGATAGTAGGDLVYGVGSGGNLNAGAGDDLLVDGPGQDTLRGGAGADIFVPVADGQQDVILDFDIAVDRLDLSLWPWLRNATQVTVTPTASGALLSYGNEVLDLRTANGLSLTVAQVRALIALPVSRYPMADPVTPVPQGQTVTGTAAGDTLAGGIWADTLQGGEGGDLLLSGPGADLFDGGPGVDRVSYAAETTGLVVDLAGPAAGTGNAAGDGFIGIEEIEGSALDDTLRGSAGADVLFGGGGGGRDVIEGRDGDDLLDGGGGNDALDGGVGADSLYGGGGSDLLAGGDSADLLDGGAGVDSLAGGAGDDSLAGGDLADLLEGGEGNDSLDGGTGADTLLGGPGNDSLYGFNDDDVMIGDGGADHFDGGNGFDLVDYSAEAAGVQVNFTTGTGAGAAAGDSYTLVENIIGTPFADTLTGDSAPNHIWGRDGADLIRGEAANDVLEGEGGADRLYGGVGDDTLHGGDGDDKLYGDGGRSLLYGGAGRDVLSGNAVEDSLIGGDGEDRLDGRAADDLLEGGAGLDTIYGGKGDDSLWGGDGDDGLGGLQGADWLDGGGGNDRMGGGLGRDRLYGGEGNDTLEGEEDDDHLDAGAGNDRLMGGIGRDTLLGGDGADRLTGGEGGDWLTGGAGADVFIFDDAGPGLPDIITDFEIGIDRLQLTGVAGLTSLLRFAALDLTETLVDGLPATEISHGGQVIVLHGITPGELSVLDFIFL